MKKRSIFIGQLEIRTDVVWHRGAFLSMLYMTVWTFFFIGHWLLKPVELLIEIVRFMKDEAWDKAWANEKKHFARIDKEREEREKDQL